MENKPETPRQDNPHGDVDVIQLICNEFGSSPAAVKAQVALATIEIDDQPYEPKNRYRLPREDIVGRSISVIGPERQWRIHKYEG